MKSEPDTFGIEHLKSKGTAPWDGVRNYLARNHMQQMAAGDQVLFYHSSCNPAGVAGLATVARTAYPDHTALDPGDHHYDAKSTPEKPIWMMVDVAYAETLPRLVTLAELRAIPELADLMLFTHNRLSVIPITPLHYATIVNAAQHPAPAITTVAAPKRKKTPRADSAAVAANVPDASETPAKSLKLAKYPWGRSSRATAGGARAKAGAGKSAKSPRKR